MAKEKIIIQEETIQEENLEEIDEQLEGEKFRIYPEEVWTEEDIKKYLRRRAKLLRHTPNRKEINQDKDGPRLKRVKTMFGSYERAILAAGLELPPRPWSSYSNEELIEVVRTWSEQNPTGKLSRFLLTNHPDLPNPALIASRFGNVYEYFRLAGVPYEDGTSPWKTTTSIMSIPRPAGAMTREIYNQGR